MGFASRTDKAHSQDGEQYGCRCDWCLPRRNWNRASEKRQAIADQLRDDSPVRAVTERPKTRKQPKVQAFYPRRRTFYTPPKRLFMATNWDDEARYGDMHALRRSSHSLINAGDNPPSLMQMAKAREAELLRMQLDAAVQRRRANIQRRRAEVIKASKCACGAARWECDLLGHHVYPDAVVTP